jgi:hypothetical protein
VDRDLLCKLRAQKTFDSDGMASIKSRGPEAKTLILTIAQEEEWELYALEGSPPEVPEVPFKIPGVWAEDNCPGLSRNVPPAVVELKPGATPVSQKQYFIPRKAQVRIQKTPDRLLKYGILQP